MTNKRKKTASNSITNYVLICLTALLLGLTPVALVLSVDPFEVFSDRDRTTSVSDLAEKSHYPLWSLSKYRKSAHSVVVLGDSRARSLRAKYWDEAGITDVLNVAYGGGTVPEIYSTFNHIKSDPTLEHIVLGIQLRSLDEDHKSGMNRVPEAIRLIDNKFAYASNWLAASAAWRIMAAESGIELQKYEFYLPTFVGAANAAELPLASTSISHAQACSNCELPEISHFAGSSIVAKPVAKSNRKNSLDVAAITKLYVPEITDRILPAKMARQVEKNGRADWNDYELSNKYWQMIVEISEWARENGKRLWFVIPPTIVEMQGSIHQASLSKQNHQLRIDLSTLGTVVDFDFPNDLTIETGNFSDAYHFNSTVARNIVAEISGLIHADYEVARKRLKSAPLTMCGDVEPLDVQESYNLTEYQNCRIWEAHNENS